MNTELFIESLLGILFIIAVFYFVHFGFGKKKPERTVYLSVNLTPEDILYDFFKEYCFYELLETKEQMFFCISDRYGNSSSFQCFLYDKDTGELKKTTWDFYDTFIKLPDITTKNIPVSKKPYDSMVIGVLKEDQMKQEISSVFTEDDLMKVVECISINRYIHCDFEEYHELIKQCLSIFETQKEDPIGAVEEYLHSVNNKKDQDKKAIG